MIDVIQLYVLNIPGCNFKTGCQLLQSESPKYTLLQSEPPKYTTLAFLGYLAVVFLIGISYVNRIAPFDDK